MKAEVQGRIQEASQYDALMMRLFPSAAMVAAARDKIASATVSPFGRTPRHASGDFTIAST